MNSLSSINKYHDLVTIKVRPSQLVLDPSNPRINVDVDASHTYTEEELLSDRVQQDILKKINKDEYRVTELKNGIKRQGYLSGAGPFIVERIGQSDKLLVLEGNRRTTAIKSLLTESDTLDESVAKSLEILEVKEFRYIDNNFYSKEEIIDVLLGTIHITGAVGWGAMEKAHYIYKSYLRELDRVSIKGGLRIDGPTVQKLSDFFNSKRAEIKKNVWIYSVYQQLSQQRYPVDSKKFSLIELAIADSKMRQNYFELDQSCKFSDEGLERFSTLCLEPGCPVKNPDDFKRFKYIYQHGTTENIAAAESGMIELEELCEHVKEFRDESRIIGDLREILKRLRELNVAGFAGDAEESRVVQEISRVVNKKLVAMLELDNEEEDRQLEDWYLPSSVPELMELEPWQVHELIKDTLKSRPNSSCVRDKLPTFVLRFNQIRSSGRPREEAVSRIVKDLDTMIGNGLVQAYKTGKNNRIRLLVD